MLMNYILKYIAKISLIFFELRDQSRSLIKFDDESKEELT